MITASIVLYNTKEDDIRGVISSFSPSEERILYIIDNSPQVSDFCEKLESEFVEYIFNKKNIGYGSAQNIGIKKAIERGSDYHIVLNADIFFETKILYELKEYADKNPDVVYMLPKVVYPTGEIQYLCKLLPTPFDLFFRRFFPSKGIFARHNDKYTLKDSGYDKIMNPPCLSGCFMFMRTSILNEHSICFDERFFMYCEDFDIIRRLHIIGKTIYYPKCLIIHNHAKGSYKNSKLLFWHLISAFKYFNKYGWLFDKVRREQNDEILRFVRNGFM